ncbi:MAG: TIGR02453 family protein [Acidimicrobiia bacterium]|jgi:uncharacterized protein (TIGR02453 family)
MTRYFTPEVFKFLRELEANNNREWWEANKSRYVERIREPALDFIADFSEKLGSISPHFAGDTRVNGGSLMRPYRDLRFAKDKTPYKSNVGIQFRHRRGKDVHAPGFYVHIAPGQNFIGAGMWQPEARVARMIRQAIHDDPDGWGLAAHSNEFEAVWSIDDNDRLQRTPRELDSEHPYPDDLRLKSFTAARPITQRTVTSAGFADELLESFTAAGPYTRFLTEAIGVAF